MPRNDKSLNIEQASIGEYYDCDPNYEWNRLVRHRMEFAITQKAILEYGPSIPANVLDCGGGPGRYSIWLSDLGYAVTLLDLSVESLKAAKVHAAEASVDLTNIVHGTATDLVQFDDGQFDVVLLLGPLYHLMEHAERIRAIEEAKRVLRKDGILFAAFLNRFELVRYVARFQPELVLQDAEMIDSVLNNGDARSDKYPDAFSNYSYWAHPAEIEPLMIECGFEKVTLFSAEGVVAYLDDEMNELKDERWDAWVNINYRLSNEPELRGSGIHLIYVGRKREGT